MRCGKGFTLLEVLVALAIFAVTASALLKISAENLRNHLYLENRTLATWVIKNKATAMKLQSWEELENGSEVLTMARRNWLTVYEVESDEATGLKKILLNVSLEGQVGERQQLSTMTLYLGQH
jgi:general secretion pathway protein I